MGSVIIKGSLMPAAGVLARGEHATVQYTPRIAKLARRGHIEIVEFLDDDETPVSIPEPESQHQVLSDAGGDDEPSRAASTEVWAEFLTTKGFAFAAGTGRTELIALWDARHQDTPLLDG